MIRSLKTWATCLAMTAGGCAASSQSGSAALTEASLTTSPTERSPTGSEAYHGLIQYRAKDAKEAIVEPVLVPAQEATLAAGTKVIGVFVNGEARAYPLFILNNHQVVNDLVGGTPLSASW